MSPGPSLEGRVCAVTGASSGLGRAIADALAGAGAAVVGLARRFSLPSLEGGPVAGQVSEVHLDVTDDAQVAARFGEIGPLDVLVACAGQTRFVPFLDMGAADLRAMLESHVVGAFTCARAAVPAMRARGGGHIVNVSSVAAFRTFPEAAGYSAAKEGLRGLTRVMTEELRPLHIRVTGLYPGAIDTPIWDGREGFDRTRMMRPADVADLVVAILSRPAVSVEELLVMPPGGAL